MDRGARSWVTHVLQRIDPILLQEIFQTLFFINNIENKPALKKTTGRWYARNTHLRKQVVLSRIFKRVVPVDYSYQSKKKYQEPFSFTCSVTTLPVFYRKRLTVRTSLSTWSHRFTSRDLYLRCRSLASRTKCSFYICLPEINGSNSKLFLL